MNHQTIRRLVQLNQHFYNHFASAFSATRSRPWRGWAQVLEHLDKERPLNVLDVGCGNGRFALYLEACGHPIRYLGIDENTDLLRFAADHLAHLDRPKFLQLELLSADLEAALEGAKFHLIVLFGVLHHIPATARRHRLLANLAQHLQPDGLLAASVWRPNLQPRFERKVLPWEAYNRQCQKRSEPEVDLTQLEPGDTLLTWSGDQENPRYCHFPTEDELESWLRTVDLPCVDRFDADGKSGADNLYLILRRPT